MSANTHRFDNGVTGGEMASLCALCRCVTIDPGMVNAHAAMHALVSPRARRLGRAMLYGAVPRHPADRDALRAIAHVSIVT